MPRFFEYAIEYALKSVDREWSDEVDAFDPNPIKIPPYQRKIVWGKKTITDFLESKAVIFGTVILATDPRDQSLILLDGLQRFATSTAILHYLHSDMLPQKTNATTHKYFDRLTAETASKKLIVEHNDKELRNNTRTGIRNSYKYLYDNVKSVLDEGIKDNPKEMAEKITQTFVKKQIAIDTYHKFKNANEFTQTFININSTGIDLTEVDLLRSVIIQQAEEQKWDESDIGEIENRFTEVFQSGKIKAAKVLGKHLYDALDSDPNIVFDKWECLQKDDVDDLLDFIDKVYDASNASDDGENKKWPYLYENFQCGDIPFAIIVWFYYKKLQETGHEPDFLGGKIDTTNDLHDLLRAFYRRIINSSMNRTDVVASKFIRGKNQDKIQNMSILVNEINPTEESMVQNLDAVWIKTNLKKSNTNKIKRMFNACLLPEKNAKHGNFCPLEYSQGKGWAVDYLIPKKLAFNNIEGSEQIDAIVNRIPIHSSSKKTAKQVSCLEKIKPSGLLEQDISDHPYVRWLITKHYNVHKESKVRNKPAEYAVNSLECLNNMSEPHIGAERLDKITELLRDRL